MRYCPILNRECVDGCAVNIEDECGMAVMVKAVGEMAESLDDVSRTLDDVSRTLDDLNVKLPDMEGRKDYDLYITGNINTY